MTVNTVHLTIDRTIPKATYPKSLNPMHFLRHCELSTFYLFWSSMILVTYKNMENLLDELYLILNQSFPYVLNNLI